MAKRLENENPLLVGLNPSQLQAVTTINGNIRINAVAGAGKTRVLVNRVAYMVENGVDPSEILMTTFTKKATTEMTERLSKLIPSTVLNEITIGTSHSIGYRILREEYKAMNHHLASAFSKELLINFEQKKFATEIRKALLKDKSIEKSVRTELEQVGLTSLLSVVGYNRNNGLNADQFLRNIKPTDKNLAYYEFFKEYENQKWIQKRIDTDDLLVLLVEMFKEYPLVLKKYQKKFKYLLVDESQDNNNLQYELVKLLGYPQYNLFVVGDDDQCVIEGTKIRIDSIHHENIENINVGDKVLTALTNGKTSIQTVLGKKQSTHNKAVKIVTENNKEIIVTPYHKMFAITQEKLNGEKWYNYLMWRKDLGFRIGITSNTLKQRIHQQTASKMWIIDTANDLETALYKEEYYSMKYQISKITYNLAEMGKEYTLKIFSEFGNNGFRLLDDKYLDFNLPHLQTQATNRMGRSTVNINVLMGGSKHSSLNIDTTDKKTIATLEMMGIKTQKSKEEGKRVRINSKDYKNIYAIAKRIENEFEKHEINFKMNYQASFTEGHKKLNTLNASGIYEGMDIAVYDNEKITIEKVVKTELLDGEFTFYDIETNNTHNFIANDFVVHNCMYSFRGANPNQFINFTNNYNNVTEINLDTNYRSKSHILEVANKLISNNVNRITKTMNPFKIVNEKAVVYNNYHDEMEESSFVASEIEILNKQENVKYKDIAVLFRTNKQSLAIENALIMQGIPYVLHGGLSFYERKEVKDIISYLQLAYNQDNNKAFERVINVPSRFLGKAFIEKLKGVKNTSLWNACNKVTLKPYESQGVNNFKSVVNGMKKLLESGNSITELIDFLLDNGYKNHILDDENEQSDSRMENIETLKYLLSYFKSVESFLTYVDQMTSKAKHSIDGVQLMTIHKSKGLEFNTVFGIGICENLLPHFKSIEKALEQEERNELPIAIEEERRLAYVLVTRSENKCYLSSTDFYNGKKSGTSRFIYEMGLKLEVTEGE